MGRERRPVHQHGPDDDHEAAPQARAAAGDRDGAGWGLPHPVRSRLRPTIRVRLTLLYGALFLVAGIALLAVTYVLVKQSLDGQPAIELPGAIAGRALAGPVEEPSSGVGMTVPQAEAFVVKQQDHLRADTLNSMLSRGAAALGMVGVIAFAFGYLMAERVLRPLQRITDTAHRVSGGSLAFGGGPVERIDLRGPRDEIKELADTFDEMLERLAHAF